MHVSKSLAAVLWIGAAAAIGVGQPPGKLDPKPAEKPAEKPAASPGAKPKLEELLAEALRQNPDVLIAESKLREAEAHVRHTRMQVAQKLAEAYTALESQREKFAKSEELAQTLSRPNVATKVEQMKASVDLAEAKRQLVQVEASVYALAGRLPGGQAAQPPVELFRIASPGGGEPAAQPARTPKSIPARKEVEKFNAALQKAVKVGDKGFKDVPVQTVTDFARQQLGDVACLVNLGYLNDEKVTIDFRGDTTVAGLLQVLQDAVPDLRVFVRPYGFLIAVAPEPADGIPLQEFIDRFSGQ